MSEFVPYRPGIKPTRQKLVILTEAGPDVAPQSEAEPPEQAPITSFPILDALDYSDWLHSNNLRADSTAPMKWLPHPDKPGQWVVAFRVTSAIARNVKGL